MRKKLLLFLLLLAAISVILACSPSSTQRSVATTKTSTQIENLDVPLEGEPWAREWNKTVESARKEGRLVVISTAGPTLRSALVSTFKEKFGIDMEMILGKGAEVSQKLISEQRAGLYLVDIYVGGATTPVTQLKPTGAFIPMEPNLVLPEVLDGKVWLEGQLPWIDRERIILTSMAYPNLTLGVNTEQVRPGEIKSYRDLLNPKWKGKIVLNDPTLAGVGGKWAIVVSTIIMNWDYLREIAKHEPVIITDQRIQVDWLAKGKYPISIVPKPEIFKEFQEAGAPIKGMDLAEGTWLATGSSAFSLVNKAPHPSAAKVFINWILTKEGQALFSKALGVQSARLDVPTDLLDPLSVRKSEMKYFNASTEEFLLAEPEKRKIVIEIFSSISK